MRLASYRGGIFTLGFGLEVYCLGLALTVLGPSLSNNRPTTAAMTKVNIVTYEYQTSSNEHKAILHMYTEYI